jgi:hypothetical protein
MSVWMVSRAHIDALVLAGVQWRVVDKPDPAKLAELGRTLWAENLASVAHQNPRDGDGPAPDDSRHAGVTAYTAPTDEVLLTAAGVLKAIDCYTYQSCEHPRWADPGNPARRYTEDLRLAVLASEPPGDLRRSRYGGGEPVGYDAAPWGVQDLAQITAVTVESGGS